MGPTHRWPVQGGEVNVVVSTRADGDFHLERVGADDLRARCQRLVPLPWTMAAECHGTELLEVRGPGDRFGERGDILATSVSDAVLGIWVGDCAPLVLWGADGRVVAAHVGWRGLAAGIVDLAVDAAIETSRAAMGADGVSRVTDVSASGVSAFIGPCIGPCCYAFGDDDLGRVATAVGTTPAEVSGTDRTGRTSLDMRRALAAALGRRDVSVYFDMRCTGCCADFYSHRMRAETQRHVVGVWRS